MSERIKITVLRGVAGYVLTVNDKRVSGPKSGPYTTVAEWQIDPAVLASPAAAPREPIWTTTACPTCGTEVEGIRVLTEAELGRAPAAAPLEKDEGAPDDLRAAGWAVAVHNDYRLGGVPHTFWLLTKGDRCVKGEGRSDAEALNQIRAALATPSAPASAPAAATDPVREALRRVEWKGPRGTMAIDVPPWGRSVPSCPECGRFQPDGHRETCAVGRALAAPAASTPPAPEVLEVTDCSGEPLAVYVRGHVPTPTFMALAVRQFKAWGRNADEELSDSESVTHEWWRSEPCDCGDHGEHFVAAVFSDPDAYAVTVLHVTDAKWLSARAAPPPGARATNGSNEEG